MNFSETFKHSKGLCKFSPDGNYLASITEFRLLVRELKSLQIHRLYTCDDVVHYIEWSADSQFILCWLRLRSVQIWNIEESSWKCKIKEEFTGLSAVMWGPDSRHIMTTAEFHLRLTIWSLTTRSVSYIKYPKKCSKGYDFSRDGRQMVMAERRSGSDFVSVFNCHTWDLDKHFSVLTDDLDGVMFSPTGEKLAVWEDCVQYLVLIYRVTSGQCVGRYSAYRNALGIKTVQWSSSGQFLAIGSYDQKVRVLNNITWSPIMTQHHPSTVQPHRNLVVFQETATRCPEMIKSTGLTKDTGSLFVGTSKYIVQETEMRLPYVKPDTSRGNPKMGVSRAVFSPNCLYLYTVNDNMPCTLWIWDMTTLTLAAIVNQADPIKCITWDPCIPRLALCTGTKKLFMWSPAGCAAVEIPVEGTFLVEQLTWQPKGQSLLLQNKLEYCMCYLHDI